MKEWRRLEMKRIYTRYVSSRRKRASNMAQSDEQKCLKVGYCEMIETEHQKGTVFRVVKQTARLARRNKYVVRPGCVN